VDPWFIVYRTPEEARLIRTARIVNDEKPLFVLGTIEEGVRRMSSHPTIACFGLSFKPDVGDLRESPAVEIVQKLSEKNIGRIVVVEPHVKVLPRSLRDQGVGLASAAEAIRSADILVFLVDHKEFWNLDPATFRDKLVVDPRGIWARKVHSTTR
jgi:UDP-N-acetyl-D-mannosaminuronic acid dehydrogenase